MERKLEHPMCEYYTHTCIFERRYLFLPRVSHVPMFALTIAILFTSCPTSQRYINVAIQEYNL